MNFEDAKFFVKSLFSFLQINKYFIYNFINFIVIHTSFLLLIFYDCCNFVNKNSFHPNFSLFERLYHRFFLCIN